MHPWGPATRAGARDQRWSLGVEAEDGRVGSARKAGTLPGTCGARAPDGAPVSSTETPEQFGNYHLLEKIATGGMAEVWRAR